MKKRKHLKVVCSVCGKEMQIRYDYVKKHSGICISCQKKGNSYAIKHGDYKDRLYKIWIGLKHRRYPNNKPNICKEWSNYETFKTWSLRNGYSDMLTIDRINNYGDYEPSNCQWITLQENASKDKIIFTDEDKIEIYEERKKLKITQIEMAKLLNVSRNTIQRAEKYAKEVL